MNTTAWPAADTPASEVIAALGLQPLDIEGGYWSDLYRVGQGNAIHFLMTPEGFSALHLLTITEGWTWLAGAPANMLQLGERVEHLTLDREHPAALVPANTWQGTSTTGAWTLVTCWCVPAFTDECFSLGDRHQLSARYPQAAQRISELTR